MSEQDWIASCPTCGKRVGYRRGQENTFFPFCGERCKLIDLGKWLDEKHRIVDPAPGASGEPEQEGGGGGEAH